MRDAKHYQNMLANAEAADTTIGHSLAARMIVTIQRAELEVSHSDPAVIAKSRELRERYGEQLTAMEVLTELGVTSERRGDLK